MKKTLFFLVFLLNYCTLFSQSWIQKKDIGFTQANGPVPRMDAVGFTINHKEYVGTGTVVGKDFWMFDPSTNIWTQIADFGGVNRASAIAFSIGNKGYVGTGDTILNYTSSPMNDFWEYDPSANIWTRKADYAGGNVCQAIGFSIDSLGYVGTGLNSGLGATHGFWAYNPNTDSWTPKANFGGTARFGAISFAIDNKGYVGLGLENVNTAVNDFWEYDPSMDVWNTKAAYPDTSNLETSYFSLLGKGYVGTGVSMTGSPSQDFWEFNPIANTWTRKSNYNGGPRERGIGFSIDSFGYIGIGADYQGVYNDFNKYNPVNDQWSMSASFGGPGRESASGFEINGKCYIGLGDNAELYPNDFWMLDPNTDIWTQVATFPGASRTNAVSFSIGDKGYIGTGEPYASVSGGDPMKDFWEYKPTTNQWRRLADLPGPSRQQAVGFSIGNMGYVGTGGDSMSEYLQDFWAYNPATDMWTRKADFGGPNRAMGSGFSINNKGYIGLGVSIDSFGHILFYNDFWSYDTTLDIWNRVADFPDSANALATSFGIGNKGYVLMGRTNWFSLSLHSYFFEYNPDINLWTRKLDYPGDPVCNALGISGSDGAYIIGGEKENITFSANCWEYLPECSFTQSLCLVSMDTMINKPIVVWEKANKYATDSFYIYRANTPDSVYTQVAAIGRDSLSVWEDMSAYPDSMSYRYKISVLDTCDNTAALSPYHQTIYLTSLGRGSFSWIPYVIEGGAPPIGTFGLYRDDVTNGNWQLISLVSDTQTAFNDPNYALYPRASYRIVIVLSDPCSPTRSISTITSNTVVQTSAMGISTITNPSRLVLRPNPFTDHLTISSIDQNNETKTLEVTDPLGESIYTSFLNGSSIVIDTHMWQSGVYLVKVSSNSYTSTAKVVKW